MAKLSVKRIPAFAVTSNTRNNSPFSPYDQDMPDNPAPVEYRRISRQSTRHCPMLQRKRIPKLTADACMHQLGKRLLPIRRQCLRHNRVIIIVRRLVACHKSLPANTGRHSKHADVVRHTSSCGATKSARHKFGPTRRLFHLLP